MNDKIDKTIAKTLLRNMMLARKFEENVQYYFSLGMIHGTTHLGIGEEATAAGSCAALQATDDLYATHRGHSSVLCKGADPKRMMAEVFGKSTGLCKGHGGSMHLADVEHGIMGTNGIVAAALPLACGCAYAHKTKGDGIVTAVFFGDGATNEGIFHESMNLASVMELPLIFICTNNTYGMSTHISKVMKDTNLLHRALPYKMHALEVDGNDVMAVYRTVMEARDYVTEHNEPVFVLEHTYRISGHSKSDGNLYRTKEEIAQWKAKDPIARFRDQLLAEGILSGEEIDTLDQETTHLMEEAVQYAIDSPYPELEELKNDVYAP